MWWVCMIITCPFSFNIFFQVLLSWLFIIIIIIIIIIIVIIIILLLFIIYIIIIIINIIIINNLLGLNGKYAWLHPWLPF